MSLRVTTLAAALAALFLSACPTDPQPPVSEGQAPASAEVTPAVAAVAAVQAVCPKPGTSQNTLQLNCPALPNTTGLPGTNTGAWELFAWNSFISLNWPALDPEKHQFNRGFPDLSQSFASADHDELVVWETLKEKREVFYNQYSKALVGAQPPPSPWNSAVHYGEPVPANVGPDTPPNPLDIAYCSGVAPPANRQQLFQSGKLFVDDLDETLEVSSEALEGDALLCPPSKPNCGVEGNAVGPRVWKGKPSDPNPNPVLYEVKVNYDFFDYVLQNQLYADTVKAQFTSPKQTDPVVSLITLPFRTDAPETTPGMVPPAGLEGALQELPGTNKYDNKTPPGKLVPRPAPSYANPTNSYSAANCLKTYQGAQAGTAYLTPCPQGSVHLKAAWIRLTAAEASSGKYHTAESIYFRTENGKSCMDVDTFGLVGLHIIQRIHTVDSGKATGIGGTFVFATWEHTGLGIPTRTDPTKVDPAATSGYSYSNYLGKAKPDQANPPPPGFYPPISTNPAADRSLPITRRFDLTQSTKDANTNVWKAIGQVNPNSVWLNYQLIGVQFTSDDALAAPKNQVKQQVTDNPCVKGSNPNDPSCLGQQFYLANALLETNEGLQFFQGAPPQSGENRTNDYVRTKQNLQHESNLRNMGGCMGCHGVARLKGTAFSFVLLLGQAGAGVDTGEEFEIPADPFGQVEGNCADGTIEGVAGGGVACAGAWTTPGIGGTGANAAQALCAAGSHICTKAELTSCDGVAGGFYAAATSGPGNFQCGTGANDLFGCGDAGVPSRSATCDPLNRASNNLCSAIASQGWACGTDGFQEFNNAVHTGTTGGVMCCPDE